VIAKASRTTVVLQVFAVVLLAILVSVYADMASRQGDLRDTVRENAMWSVYQLDREARDLEHQLHMMLISGKIDAKSLQELSLHYDIVYSRMAILRDSKFEENFLADDGVAQQMNKIERVIFNSEPVFDAIRLGEIVSASSLNTLRYELSVLARESADLVVYTNTTISAERAQARIELGQLQRKSMFVIGFLVLAVVFLIVTLQRQLRSVRAAGVSLEAMAKELSVSYKAAEAGNSAKSQFMATMGHEIRTPLNAILGMVELLELTRLPAEPSAQIRTIRRSGEALLDIINEILDYAKIEHGKLELERRPVDLLMLAETSAEMMRGRATEAGNKILVDLPYRWRARYVLSDPTRLRQVMLNLMSNAVKFTTDGIVTLRMRQVLSEGELWLRVEVQDSGIGIGEDGKQKLFRPFSQVDASISRRYGGTGLGLTICKEIIDRFGGRVGVDSEVGRGSTFWFELPVEATQLRPQETAAPANHTLEPLPRLNILVAEDNKVNQQVIIGYLKHLGQHVVMADNGAVALEQAAAVRFDLILMDMQMPVMDGIEATRRLRTSNALSFDTPIVALTANASEQDRNLCLEAGMAGFQAKPISIAMLHRLIADTARQRGIAPTIQEELPLAADSSAPQSVEVPDGKVDNHDPGIEIDDAFARRRQEIAEVLGAEAFEELMTSFFDDAVDLLSDLRQSMQDGRHERLDGLLHNLKGAAANIGLSEIAQTSQTLRNTEPTLSDIEELSEKITAARHHVAA
jgi:signal transduction histidine kinase/CheY-like chemotaxis protein